MASQLFARQAATVAAAVATSSAAAIGLYMGGGFRAATDAACCAEAPPPSVAHDWRLVSARESGMKGGADQVISRTSSRVITRRDGVTEMWIPSQGYENYVPAGPAGQL
jgi:hypothetical protein|eukprot:COSAG01_NODE_11923_length_1835_cov_1.025346_1_plen_109_part_00